MKRVGENVAARLNIPPLPEDVQTDDIRRDFDACIQGFFIAPVPSLERAVAGWEKLIARLTAHCSALSAKLDALVKTAGRPAFPSKDVRREVQALYRQLGLRQLELMNHQAALLMYLNALETERLKCKLKGYL
jgi:hypothetical protein